MKIYSTLLCICLFTGVLALRGSGEAQVPPANDIATGKGLDEVAYRVVAALDARDHDALWEFLAPWRQASIALAHEKFLHLDETKSLTDERAAELAEEFDPEGKLGIDGAAKVRQLTPAQFFAFFCGLLHPDLAPDPSKRAGWYMVERVIGLSPAGGMSQRDERPLMMVMPWIGAAQLENRLGHYVQMQLAPSPSGWVVTDMIVERDGAHLWLSQISARIEGTETDIPYSGPSKGRQAEGEQLLGSMKNRVKVAYAKTGRIPSNLTGKITDAAGGCGASPEELRGKYYDALDSIRARSEGRDKAVGALVARPKSHGDPWLVMRFDCLNPANDGVTKYRTEKAVEEAFANEK